MVRAAQSLGLDCSVGRDRCSHGLPNDATPGPRGIHGEISEVLFPVLHGTLWYTGMAVVPPLGAHGAAGVSRAEYDQVLKMMRDRLANLPRTDPIPYRHQNGGDHDEHLLLHSDRAPGQEGIHIHRSGVDPTPCDRTGSPTEAAR